MELPLQVPRMFQMTSIRTQNLVLVPAGFPTLDAIVSEDWATLSRQLGGVDLADSWMHFPEAMAWMRDFLLEHPDQLGWWSFLTIHQNDHRLIGTCGYKGVPDPDGFVEIGYEIAPAYQGRGFATEVARALVDRAFMHEAVKSVLAHTLAEENASVKVLRRLNFVFTEEVIDPEDGTIWRWQLVKPA